MKFLKGMVVGTIVSTGVMMVVADNMNNRTLRKKGKKLMRKLENMM